MKTAASVLLVEDNAADVDLTRETLSTSRLQIELDVARNGVEALDWLHACLDEGRELPDLILLDLNLPRKNGREVLAEMRSTPSYKHLPVVVLSSSEAERDIAQCYALGANCYVAKPVGFDAFKEIVEAVEHFWFSIVRLPKASA